MLQIPYFKKNKGFTLLELTITIFVILVGVLGAYGVTQRIISYISFCEARFTATYLAQEGIEIVRNIRDGNWIDSAPSWNNGLTNCNGGCEADYNDTPLSVDYNPDHYLNLESGTGLYGYNSGTKTDFKRRITIDSSTPDILIVTVEVWWDNQGPVTAQENLYHWYY